MISLAFPKEDRRLALAFFLAITLHLIALFSGPAGHHGATSRTNLAARLNPVLSNHPAEPHPDRHQDEPKRISRKDSADRPRETSAKQESASEEDSAAGKPFIAIAGLPAPYFSILDLTQDPRFGEDFPEFLPLAISHTEGKVVFVIYLDENGVIDRLESSSEGKEMDFATRYLEQLIRAAQIKPGEIDGEPVRTRWVIEFSLSPSGYDLVSESPTPASSAPQPQKGTAR